MVETKKKPAAKKPAPKKTTSTASAKKPAAAKKPASKKPATKKPAAKAAPAKKSTTTPKSNTNSSTKKAPAKKTTATNASAKPAAKRTSANIKSSNNISPERPQLTRQEQRVQDLLAEGTCHLPGNGWWEDWWMHLSNGHPVLSVCCQHVLNPVKKSMRLVQLLASVAMGLIITNILYIAFIHDDKEDDLVKDLTKQDNVDWDRLNDHQKAQIEKYTTVEVSAGMAFLWTVGSGLQAIFDSSMFYITTCGCCALDISNPRIAKLKSICNTFVIIGVILIAAIASMSAILRANVEGGGDLQIAKNGNSTGNGARVERDTISNKDNYEFMLSFALELVFSWFVWFPIVDIILFSGILARWKYCKCLGGGRPADLEAQGDVEQGRTGQKK